MDRTNAIPVVLVHGFWHGSWCWTPVIEELAAAGVAAVAVDLAGHGLNSHSPGSRWARPFSPAAFATEMAGSAQVTASSSAERLVAQLRRIGGGRPCLVVAHSMGGVVATAAAELAPELFAELLYVTAFAPVAGMPPAAYIPTAENAGESLSDKFGADPAVVGSLRLDLGDSRAHEVLREIFYADVDPGTARAAISLLTPDGPIGVCAETLTVTSDRYGSIPHSYVVCTGDRIIMPPLQHRFVREIDAVSVKPTIVYELATSHSPFLSQPADLAAIIRQTAPAGSR